MPVDRQVFVVARGYLKQGRCWRKRGCEQMQQSLA